ncbi:MAG: phosphorylase [Cyanobacteriota bacterium]|nr:phosphorylase [Cyanobacteriota bacterium]
MSETNKLEQEELGFKAGTLWEKVTTRTQHALKCGALQSIPTEYEFVEQERFRFLTRILTQLQRRDEAIQEQHRKERELGQQLNPFLPYDEDLFVRNLSPTHLCLLNKYNVVEHHLLMITRAFEEQETWLSVQDFEAMWLCLQEIEGLAFFNGGTDAGASQRHKHLQLVPFPLVPDGSSLWIETILEWADFDGIIGTIPQFPFTHAIARFEPLGSASPQQAAQETFQLYQSLLKAVGLSVEGERQTGAYNLLATREGMMVVPRSRESYESISVNSLGFAGALLVRTQEQLELLKEIGPIGLLEAVARSPSKS